MSEFRRALAEGKFFVLDGATGTMLQAAGLPGGMVPERFCLEVPERVRSVHAAYARAGADVLITATFGANRFKLPPDIEPQAFNRTMAELAVSVAREAGRRVYVAGNVGPSGLFLKPLGELEPMLLVEAFRTQIRGLVQGGVDCIFIETQFDLAEARAAVVAAHQECALPVLVSMTFEQGMSLTGTSPAIFAHTMLNLGVEALGTNCGTGPEQMREVVKALLSCSSIPVLAEPNAGLPELVGDKTVFRLPPDAFAEETAAFAAAGVQLLGGCCGTTPEHIAALRRTVDGLRPQRTSRPGAGSARITLTTRTQLVSIGEASPLVVIGERINPTGKKVLSEQLRAGEFTQALCYADEQVQAGAQVLDVNVGAPLVDEGAVLPELVQRLILRHPLPLSLDSPNARAIAGTLPYCPGSPLVNSVSGEKGRMEELGPLCRLWGAPFILLPLRGKELPVKAAARIAILEDLLAQAEALGIPRRLLLVDVLALAVSANGEAGRQGLETIRWCVGEGLPTVIGLSNVSFGLPARELINAAFLAMAAGAGVSACIANPGNRQIRAMVDCADLLLTNDPHAARFIAGYADWTPGVAGLGSALRAAEPAGPTSLREAVLRGDSENVCALLERELAAGAAPFALVQDTLIPAITEVGERYERREYFLPQLIRSAQSMQAAFARLKPLLEQENKALIRPVVVLATVEGDIHDIGKNIVALLLSNHGFEVVDAGKDVKGEDIVEKACRHKAALIGLSALMTTTMVRMEDTVRLLKERGLPIKVMVGGAVLTGAYAESIGADGYAADAVGAVSLAKRLLSG